jgi:glycosyltransferase involved in cell wall biosynthesis
MAENVDFIWITACALGVKSGGVGRAIHMLKNSNIFKNKTVIEKNVNYLNFYQKLSFFYAAITSNGKNRYLIHSIFNVYSLILILLCRNNDILIMSHGELLGGALKIKRTKKVVVLSVLKFANYLLKNKFLLICSGQEEVENLARYVKISNSAIIQDLVEKGMLLNQNRSRSDNSSINVIIIGRLVENKDINTLLRRIIEAKRNNCDSYFIKNLFSISLFLVFEDLAEYELLENNIKILIENFGIRVAVNENLNHHEIKFAIDGMENKVSIIPSKFESFSNVLIETLNFEYIPVVWFHNQLVDKLSTEGLCTPLAHGALPEDLTLNKSIDNVTNFVEKLRGDSEAQLRAFMLQFVSNSERNT